MAGETQLTKGGAVSTAPVDVILHKGRYQRPSQGLYCGCWHLTLEWYSSDPYKVRELLQEDLLFPCRRQEDLQAERKRLYKSVTLWS